MLPEDWHQLFLGLVLERTGWHWCWISCHQFEVHYDLHLWHEKTLADSDLMEVFFRNLKHEQPKFMNTLLLLCIVSSTCSWLLISGSFLFLPFFHVEWTKQTISKILFFFYSTLITRAKLKKKTKTKMEINCFSNL